MNKKKISKLEEERIKKKVEREFYGIDSLKNIHYHRYMKELEWQNATPKVL